MNLPDPEKVRAVVYGQAIGDALGVPVEMKTRAQIVALGGITQEYKASSRSNGESFKAGQHSDDTDMSNCILDAYLADPTQDIDLLKLAGLFVTWSHTQLGMGSHTRKVLSHPNYLSDPWTTSRLIWVEREKTVPTPPAPNGAVMRAAVVGTLRPWDPVWTNGTAGDCARITHFGDSCVASAILISSWVASELRGVSYTPDNHMDWRYIREGFETLDKKPMGETSKPYYAAAWAMNKASDFWSGVKAVIEAGGDTDTNGAVAGACLGAKFGIGEEKGIPQILIEGLLGRKELDERIERLLESHQADFRLLDNKDQG